MTTQTATHDPVTSCGLKQTNALQEGKKISTFFCFKSVVEYATPCPVQNHVRWMHAMVAKSTGKQETLGRVAMPLPESKIQNFNLACFPPSWSTRGIGLSVFMGPLIVLLDVAALITLKHARQHVQNLVQDVIHLCWGFAMQLRLIKKNLSGTLFQPLLDHPSDKAIRVEV